MTTIRLTGINKSFAGVHAVRDIHLTIASGSLFALLGPSGCGKTTLLRMLAGLEQVDSGNIHFDDDDLTAIPAEQRRIGMVFQHYALFPHMTVEENVAFGLKAQGTIKGDIQERVRETLNLVGLADKSQRPTPALSGGEQQRVALARALVINPRVLLFDEPLSNLDARLRIETRHALRQLISDLNITSVFVTHDQEEALSLADDMAVMNAGEILQQGSAINCYQQPESLFVGRFLGRANIIKPNQELLQLCAVDKESSTASALIRPEHIRLCANDDPDYFLSCKVYSVEFQGSHQRLYMRCDSQSDIEMLINSDAACPEMDSTVHLAVDPQHVRFLDN